MRLEGQAPATPHQAHSLLPRVRLPCSDVVPSLWCLAAMAPLAALEALMTWQESSEWELAREPDQVGEREHMDAQDAARGQEQLE